MSPGAATALETFEGTWEEISRMAGGKLSGRRLRVTILPNKQMEQAPSSGMLRKGMFPQLMEVTEEDFKLAEFQANLDEGQ